MLKLSNRGLYGIKALYELARNDSGKPLAIKEISRRHNLPVPFLEQVMYRLKKKGLVKSRRGVNGGFELSRPPEDITLGDAIRALEGPIALCDCLRDGSRTVRERAANCVTSGIYRKIGRKVESAFDSVTLSELAGEDPKDSFLATCSHV